jgi:hypothetical protein
VGGRARRAELPPHSMYWERPDLFNDAIRRFLKEVAAA